MTKHIAIAKMREGKPVTHHFFSDEEFIIMKNDAIYDENGARLLYFWTYRQSIEWERGWAIHKSWAE